MAFNLSGNTITQTEAAAQTIVVGNLYRITAVTSLDWTSVGGPGPLPGPPEIPGAVVGDTFVATATATAGALASLGSANLGDANLSGLSGITGVTVAAGDVKTIYTIAATTNIVINGACALSPYVEQLIIQDATTGAGNTSPIVVNTGTFNIGATATRGVFDASITAIEFTRRAVPWWSGATSSGDLTGSSFVVGPSGTLNWNGGAILGPATYSLQGACNIGGNASVVSIGDDGAPSPYLSRFLSENVNITALNYVGGTISLGDGYEGIRASIDRFNAGTAYLPQYEGPNGATVAVANTLRRIPVTIFGSSSLGNNIDFGVERNCVLNIENHVQGTGSSSFGIAGGGQPENTNAGHNIFYRTFETNVTNIFGTNVEGYVFMRDYNNSERKNQTIAGAVIDDRVDFVYNFPLNGGISNGTTIFPGTSSHLFLPERSIISGIVSAGGSNLSGADNTGPYIKDLRGFTTLNADGTVATSVQGQQLMRAFIWSYAENPAIVDLDLDDGTRVALNYTGVHTPDISSTQTLAQVTAAWNNQLTITAALLTVNGAITFDDLYDFTKYRKVTDGTLREIPSAGAMILSGNLGTIDLGATNLTLTAALTTGVTNTTITTTGDINAGGNDISGIYNFDHITNLAGTTDTTLNPTSTNTIELSNFDETHTNLTISAGTYSTSNEATLTGGTIAAVTISGTGDLLSTDTAYSGTNITATGTKTFTGTTGTPAIFSSNSLVLTNNEWTSGSSISLTTGILNLDGGSYTTALAGTIATTQTWTWSNLTANSIDFDISVLSGTEAITINTNNAVTLAEAQRWVATLTTAQQSRFSVPAPAIQRQIELVIPTNTDGSVNTNVSGTFVLRNTDTNANQTFAVTSGALVGTLPTISSADTNDYIIYYKLNSTTGGTGTVYRTRIVQVPDGTGNVLVEPLVVNEFFTSGSEGNIGFTFGFAPSTGNGIEGRFITTSTPPTRAISQGAAVLAANDIDYFNWIVANELTIDPIDYQPAAVLFNNEVPGITATTNRVVVASATNSSQTSVNNWNGFETYSTGTDLIFTPGSGIAQVLNIPIGEADISTVTAAVSGSIAAGVDNSRTAERVEYIAEGRVSRIPRGETEAQYQDRT